MTLKDKRGVPVSTSNRVSLDRLEQASEMLHSYFNDPVAAIDQALADDPDFVMGHCFRAGVLCTTSDKQFEPELRKSVEAALKLKGKANDRERRHLAAAGAWLDGDYARSNTLYGDILVDHPRDILALQFAHLTDFLLGQSSMLRDRPARVMPDWDKDVPGYGYVLGMHAFGLEETGDYGRAEERGRAAIALNPRDPWAIHAVAHVMEMQARVADGIRFLTERTQDWAPDNGFAFHNWWHLALYHLDRGEFDRVLAIYDTSIRPKRSDMALEMVDASAMLWRLHLRGVDVGERWRSIADSWADKAGDGYYAFNDAHAMMAFVGDKRWKAADELLATVVRNAAQTGTNGMMTRDVGLPLCRALRAFGRGDYAAAVELLMPLCPIAHRFGGSHAQRDILSLTLIEAALRAKQGPLARALLAERTELKPASPLAWELTARARDLVGDKPGATQARGAAQRLARPRPVRASA